MPQYDYLFLLQSATNFYTDGGYSTNEGNFGVTNPNAARGGPSFGLHVEVTTTFTGMASGAIIWIVHGAATAPTTQLAGRFLTTTDLTAAKHLFIPCPPSNLQFMRALFSKVSEVATAGACTLWLGPDQDGTI